jgi:hypothetical protein
VETWTKIRICNFEVRNAFLRVHSVLVVKKDIHPHLRSRMDQRGVTEEEIIILTVLARYGTGFNKGI